MAFPKPDDLRAETIRKAKTLFEAIDDAPSGFKTETRKSKAEELGVTDKAFRWKKVVAPKFEKRGEDWPHYDDPEAAATRLQAEYGEDDDDEGEWQEAATKLSAVIDSPPYEGPSDLDRGNLTQKVGQFDPQLAQIAAEHPQPVSRILEIVRPQHEGDATPVDLLRILKEEYGVSDDSGPVRQNENGGDDQNAYDAWEEDLAAIEQGEDPNPNDLTEREQYIASKLQQGETIEALVDDLGTRRSVLKRHLKDLKRQGWSIYFDGSAEMVAIEGDNVLRSSEHKGTRTRKANRWWEMRHNELVREYRGLDVPHADLSATDGNEDWVTHLTDLHAGDKVRREDGTVIYETEEIPDVIDYITEQSLSLAEHHNADYDDAHVLWGGDMITGESIYSGQFEDLDAWLDEQLDVLVAPLIRQIKAFAQSDQFDTVNIVTVVGNHGQNRANATSRQANMDLILYKFIRNAIAELNRHAGILDNVRFKIGQAEAFRNFKMRGGQVRGHLRHGQNRKPQAETSARKKAWQATYIDHDFDIGYMGHYHVTGRIPWNGPPILSTGSPKPAGEFVERIGASDPEGDFQNVATVHGVSDDGLTCVYPVDTRNYQ